MEALHSLRRLLPFWPALGGGGAAATFNSNQWLQGVGLLALGLGLVGLAVPLFNRRDVGK
ncbi:hypothetical protein ACFFLM_16915 [Deinococcus oregonensis]|uniref:Uncharacterized protein n=1 Tax=Deinococcus oregonensis TaxID=1805970 RepID=A0ABV6B1L8_9DEIO